MRMTRESALDEEVAQIQGRVLRAPDSDAASDASAPSSAAVPLSCATGSRFDILLHREASPGGGARGKQSLRRARRKQRRLVPQPFSHLLVCDFEATCDAAAPQFPHEIIEFPVVCVDTATLAVVAEFHSFVRPARNPRLTAFCRALTGIAQEQVDAAPALPEVIRRFGAWLRAEVFPRCVEWRAAHTEGTSQNMRSQQGKFVCDKENGPEWEECERMVCFATDGPWDMRKFMYDCSVLRDGHHFPPLFYRWVNVRQCFSDHFRTQPKKLTDMLKVLGLTFHGQHHSGIDDSRNIARILIELLTRGYRVNRVSSIKYKDSKKLHVEAAVAQLTKEFGEDKTDTKVAHQKDRRKRRHRRNNKEEAKRANKKK